MSAKPSPYCPYCHRSLFDALLEDQPPRRPRVSYSLSCPYCHAPIWAEVEVHVAISPPRPTSEGYYPVTVTVFSASEGAHLELIAESHGARIEPSLDESITGEQTVTVSIPDTLATTMLELLMVAGFEFERIAPSHA